jgi:hypothetical protein
MVQMTPHDDSVFHKPSVPKNSLQLLSWVIFEPALLERYGKTLTRKQTTAQYLRTIPWTVLFVLVLSVFGSIAFSVTDIVPLLGSDKITNRYHSENGFAQSLIFHLQFFRYTEILIFGLVSGLVLCLVVGLADGLAAGLTASSSVGLFCLQAGVVASMEANVLPVQRTFAYGFTIEPLFFLAMSQTPIEPVLFSESHWSNKWQGRCFE